MTLAPSLAICGCPLDMRASLLALKSVEVQPYSVLRFLTHFWVAAPFPSPRESCALPHPPPGESWQSWPVITVGSRTLTHLWLGPTVVRSRTGRGTLLAGPLPPLGVGGKNPSDPGRNLLGPCHRLSKPERPLLLSGQKGGKAQLQMEGKGQGEGRGGGREAGTQNQRERPCL